ncbi:hypothetical protein BSK59_33195 [Paenibacillus odorifer]|uniref:hypothetical protein n=1 Tax=Paenibacillus odorifer TaxID=189426 RepID=UPI00096BF67A|nr:hypothetical protein [Paenibacillus odorifer]OME44717.1 hypothetical protein BSK59_33195 [Paenibacillus odorifer]
MAYIGSENVIPAMTAYNTPSGIVTWSSETTSSSSYKGWNVFARNIIHWQSANVPSAWVAYQFPSEKRITKYTIEAGVYPNAAPKSWTFEGSNDGVTWDILDSQTTAQAWTVGVKRPFVINNLKSYSRYRVNVSSNMVSDTYSICITNIEMFEGFYSNSILLTSDNKYYSINDIKYKETSAIPAMTSNTAPSGRVFASSVFNNSANDSWKAFDGIEGNYWATLSGNPLGNIGYEFVSKVNIRRYSILNESLNRNPKSWNFEGSNDGTLWKILDTQTNQIWDSGTLAYKEYTFINKEYFKMYRINITETSSNQGYTCVGEIKMYEITSDSYLSILDRSDEKTFISYGMNGNKSDFSLSMNRLKSIIQKNETLGTGKTFEHTVDMSKRQIYKITLL